MDQLTYVIISILCFVPAIVFHEMAHGFAAWRLGDPTAKRQGRLSVNPLNHIDPFGTIILPLLMREKSSSSSTISLRRVASLMITPMPLSVIAGSVSPICNNVSPQLDGCERGTQLVGNGGDEVVLHPVGGRELRRHVVYGVAKLADLVIIRVMVYPCRKVAVGNALGGLSDALDGVDYRANENNARHHHDRKHQQRGSDDYHRHHASCSSITLSETMNLTAPAISPFE